MTNKIWAVGDLYLGEQNCADLLDCWHNVVFDDDIFLLLGNIVAQNKSYWFQEIQKLPGRKMLFCGELESNRFQWYKKFDIEEVIPFNQTRVIRHVLGNVMFSHLPAYESVLVSAGESKLNGLVTKFNKDFASSSCILNIHGYTRGKATERPNTVDVGYDNIKGNLLELNQIIDLKLRN